LYGSVNRAAKGYRYPYQMRHTYASKALQEDEDLGYISDQLGHIDKSFILRTYTRFIRGTNSDGGERPENAFENVGKNEGKITPDAAKIKI
jgi:integrase